MDEFKGQPRLPKFAVPKRYDLRLIPDLIACTFSGTVAIDLDVVADTRFIVLNAADLSVNDASVSFTPRSSAQALPAPKVALFEEDEILVLEFGEILPHGLGVLALSFNGVLNDKMKGFYRSTYEHNGEKKNMAVTQFEPADARRCFPCWDEPACKATFKITLEVPTDLVSLSNMPVMEEKVNGNLKIVSYQESPIMSTYLVAIVVGLFDYVEDHTSDGVKVRVYCQVGKADQGKFALHVGAKTLDLFKEYFAVPYPLPKMDMIAIPDFAAGAMENYGLVTYRETALLYDEQHSAASNKQRVATVVAHELAHQWFGNLVTMEWWTHLWLNEGFATWVSYLATDSLFPEWKIWTQFLDESTEGLRLDGLEESHPIEVEVNHAAEIDEIFDAISYRKGASVIRMLQSYLGAEVFQKSLAAYIKNHAYSNAKTEDLWTALEAGSGEPVNKLMSSWTKQIGYPVVSAKIKDGKLELEQSRFLSSGSPGEGQWIVPVTLCCGSYEKRKNFLLESKSGAYDLKELLGCSIADGSDKNNATCSWIKINVDQAGFYRVKYDDSLAAGLRNATQSKSLTSIDRYGILDDSFALSMARQQSLASLLTLISAYKEELEYTVLSNLISISYKVVKIGADADQELMSAIKRFFIGVFQFAAGKLGWDPKQGESHLDAMLRGEVLTALAVFGHDETLKEAVRRFDAFVADRNTSLLPPDIRRAAYVAVMQRANKSDKSGYESLLRVYRETDLSQEKTRILGSLASCPDPTIVQDVLNFVLSDEVRNQDALYGLSGVSWEGREVAWKWLQEKWEYIGETWGSGFLITRFISAIVSPFASFEKAKEAEEFFATRSKPSMARTLKQSIERVHINANWVESIKKEDNLKQLFVSYSLHYSNHSCRYFAVPYPLPKMDMIAIPDFAAGAMENYGLVTYRETALLYDEQHSAASNKQRVATVVAHELAHQWFGNLVTMEWWTHLWLNEGFATWVSYLATDSLFPEWKIWTQFLDESTEGLRLDGLEESHPIEVEVNHAAEIDEIFDAISYRKGASVIRMLQSYLGAEVFQKSLAAYIKNHAYSNAKTEDLWTALEAGSGEPVNKLMSSWTKQIGYPVVSAKIKDGKLELEQSRFLSSGSPGEGQWIVPVTLCCGSYEKRKNFLLESKSGAYDLKELLGCSIADGSDKNNATCSWIKINVDQAGFYRVKYDDSLAAGLRNATQSKSLTSIDRYGILDDSFALSMARQQSLASLLTLISAYKEELEYTVLSNLISISYKVVKIGADADQELMSAIKRFFIGVFQFAAGKLGWDPKQGESHLDAMLRGEVLTALAVFGHDETLKEAVRRFDAFVADRNTSLLPPDIRRAAYVAVMQRANKSDKSGYESLLRVYRETDLSQEKTRILGSLASCPDPTIVQDVLNFVLSDEVRNQDALYGLSGVSWEGREVAWKWLQEKWEYIGETWGSGFLITRFISAIVSPFASFEKAKEAEEFFATRSKPSMARTLKQSIERVHINANWVESIKKEDNLKQLVAQLSSN